MKKWAILFFLLLLPAASLTDTTPSVRGNSSIDSFSKAKRLLLREVYKDFHKTFYCGSSFDQTKKVLHDAGYVPKKSWKRAHRLEWEHVVPAHAFGQSFSEWRNGHEQCVTSKGKRFKGRKCTEKTNREFRLMQADMHNLVPAIGEVNGLRSNYSYTQLPGEEREFGSCDVEIRDKKVEPADHLRGDIARIYMYMDKAYPGRGIISRKNRKLFDAWAKLDPVDDWECERQERIKKIQGNDNPFVEDECRRKQ